MASKTVTQCVHYCEKMGRSWNFLSSGCLTDLFCDDGKWFLSSNRQKYDHQTTIPWFNSLFGPVLRNRSTTYSTLSTPKSSIWWQKPLLVIIIRSVSTLYKRFWMVPNSFLKIVNTLGNGFPSHEFYEFGQELGSQSLGIGPVRLTLPLPASDRESVAVWAPLLLSPSIPLALNPTKMVFSKIYRNEVENATTGVVALSVLS